MRYAWPVSLALGLLLPSIRPVSASVVDVWGSQNGVYEISCTQQYSITDAYTDHRLTIPTAYNQLSNTSGYQFSVISSSLEVNAVLNEPVFWDDYPYFPGTLDSGHWIRVWNPHPGQTFSYKVKWTIRENTMAPAFGVGDDVCKWPLYSLDHYITTTTLVGVHIPATEAALATALGSYPNGPLPGTRGDLERIAMYIRGFSYSSTFGVGGTISTSSDVLGAHSGDCDDLVKAECAMQRTLGVPSRVVLSAAMNVGVPGLFAPPALGLHAFGEYWTGDHWEAYEAYYTTNFVTAPQVVIGIAEDFLDLYPWRNTDAPSFVVGPTSFTGTSLLDSGSYTGLYTRHFGPGDEFGQLVFQPIPQCVTRQPADATRAIGVPGDFIPPAAVPELHADAVTDHSVHVVWVATGDDGISGNATAADLRYSYAPIRTEDDFSGATPVSPQPAPGASGSEQGCTVQGLANCTWYYFALKFRDESGNWSVLGDTTAAITRGTWSGGHWICDDVRARVGPRERELPSAFALYQNEPNPIVATATFRFDLPRAEMVHLEVFDIVGRRVATLRNAWMPAGQHSVDWNSRDESGRPIRAGSYIYRLAAGSFRAERKLVMLP